MEDLATEERTAGEQAVPKEMVCVCHLAKRFGIIFLYNHKIWLMEACSPMTSWF